MPSTTPLPLPIILAFEEFERRCHDVSNTYAAESKSAGRYIPVLVPGARPPSRETPNAFQCEVLPAMTLDEFAAAIQANSGCSDDALLVGLVLMHRFVELSGVEVSAHMMHRLFAGAMQAGMKANFDDYFENWVFAVMAGVTAAELGRLEVNVCCGLSWRLMVRVEEIYDVTAPFDCARRGMSGLAIEEFVDEPDVLLCTYGSMSGLHPCSPSGPLSSEAPMVTSATSAPDLLEEQWRTHSCNASTATSIRMH